MASGTVIHSLSGQRGVTLLALLLLAAGIVLQRVHTYAEPPDRDLAVYAVIGHEMIRGRPLYADLYDNKPPLLHATFVMAERLVGYGPGEVFLINVAVTLPSCSGRGGDFSRHHWPLKRPPQSQVPVRRSPYLWCGSASWSASC